MPYPDDPTGGVPQANTEAIARGLLGDDMVDKYGHAFGVRPTTANDVMRDFALGATIGPRNLEKLQLQARKQYQDERVAALRQGYAEQQAKQQKMAAVAKLWTDVRNPKIVPLGQRAMFMKQGMEALGFPIEPAQLKLLTAADGLSDKAYKDIVKMIPTMEPGLFGMIAADVGQFMDFQKDVTDQAAKKQDMGSQVLTDQINTMRRDAMRDAPKPQTLTERARALELERYHSKIMSQQVRELDPESGKTISRSRTPQEVDDLMRRRDPAGYARTHETDQASVPGALFGMDAPAPIEALGGGQSDAIDLGQGVTATRLP